MAWGMSALSPEQFAKYGQADQTDFMLKILATEYIHPWFATVSSIVFGVLLLSAANTAIADMVSIQYLMSRDKELPAAFTRLNRYGMPWVSLAVATAVTATVLLIAGNQTELLASLYAIGVVGAIAINLLSCGTNWELVLRKWERVALLGVGALMAAIELTIAYDKHMALLFASLVLGGGLAVRGGFKLRARLKAAGKAPGPEAAPVPGFQRVPFPAEAPRLLLSTRGNPALVKFAAGHAKDKKAVLFVLFVREVALGFRERVKDLATESMNLQTDREAQELFAQVKKECEAAGVTMVPLYAVYDSPADVILDNAVTLGADALIMGASRRGALSRALRGDVFQEVAEHLPASIPLLIYS
jgi:nucleotide-binding universal stress UspA family protein